MATLIFIPGHWNTPACYDAFVQCLLSYAYSSATIILPHQGCDAATYDFVNDAKSFKNTMTDLARIRRDVIIVLHPSHARSEVKRSQSKHHAERSLKTGVSRMIFFMTHFEARGFKFEPHKFDNDSEEEQEEENVTTDLANFELERGTVTVDEQGTMKVFFQYLPECEAQHWAVRLLPHSVGEFKRTSNYTGWQTIPSTYRCHSNGIRSFRVPFAHYKIEKSRQQLNGVY